VSLGAGDAGYLGMEIGFELCSNAPTHEMAE
jgi:hypothetical protein